MASGMLKGISTLEDLRIRCRMDGDCWVWVMGKSKGMPCVSVIVDGKHKTMKGKRAALVCRADISISTAMQWRAMTAQPTTCVNPDHVKQITIKQMRKLQTENPSAQYKWKLNGIRNRDRVAKLTPTQALLIFSQKGEKSSEDLAKEFGTTPKNVLAIWRGDVWRDVTFGSMWAPMLLAA